MQTVQQCFVSLIPSYKIRKNTDFLRCTANQVSTGHKLHFQPNHPARAKFAAINNKYGCGTAEVDIVWKCFISLKLSCKVRENTALLRCTTNQVGTSHNAHLKPNHPARAKLTAINNKNACGTAEV